MLLSFAKTSFKYVWHLCSSYKWLLARSFSSFKDKSEVLLRPHWWQVSALTGRVCNLPVAVLDREGDGVQKNNFWIHAGWGYLECIEYFKFSWNMKALLVMCSGKSFDVWFILYRELKIQCFILFFPCIYCMRHFLKLLRCCRGKVSTIPAISTNCLVPASLTAYKLRTSLEQHTSFPLYK